MANTKSAYNTSVLIIDDDKSVLLILSKILAKKGFRVDTVGSGQEAINRLTAKTYAIALIDVRLQDVDGLDLLNKIQMIAPEMRKIVLTGYPSNEDRIKALERGADYYLAKPVNSERLVEIIGGKNRKDRVSNF